MKSRAPGPGIVVWHQSPPDLDLKELSENCLEKNIGKGFFYRLFSNKTSRQSKKKLNSQALC